MAKTPSRTQFTPERRDQVWEKGKVIPGKDANKYRRDDFGNELFKPSYGKGGEKSWTVDHKRPIAKGGSENLRNLRPLQADANQRKGDNYPFKPDSSPPHDKLPRKGRPAIRWL